jgi:phosphatidate cytidylyltransferase
MLKEFEKRLLSSLILIPIAFFFIIQGSVFFMFFLSLFFLATSYEWVKMTKKNNFIKNFGVIFLFFSFYSAFNVREDNGLNIFLFIIIVCIFTDLGGYIFGKTFKGPKLTKISPNKTYAGVIGSFLFSLIAGLVFIKYVDGSDIQNINQLTLFIIILSISLISQIGDLIISYFKRKAKLKDTGKILPGHGGLLDRIDGLIFVVPLIYLLQLIK